MRVRTCLLRVFAYLFRRLFIVVVVVVVAAAAAVVAVSIAAAAACCCCLLLLLYGFPNHKSYLRIFISRTYKEKRCRSE